jgi:L-threonylcarbamoyladenylate synthase
MRIPATPITLAIIEAFGEPVALTSANAHGQPAARTRNEVSAYFPQGLAHVIDDGPSPIGVPSTIVSLKDSSRIHVLREGAVTEDEILDCLRHFEGLD